MGVVLVPLFLVTLFGFGYPGIRLGGRATLNARGRSTALALLAAMSAVLAMLALVLPFAVVASSEVNMFGFCLGALICVATVAGLAGAFFAERFRDTGKPAAGLTAAAFCLAAAGFPFGWFAFADRLGLWFQVHWTF